MLEIDFFNFLLYLYHFAVFFLCPQSFSNFHHNLILLAGIITFLSHLVSHYLSLYLSSRSLPGSALELRYSHGGGSLPIGSTTHLDTFCNASAGGVVRRSHRARWSSAREDSTKVRIFTSPQSA